MKVIIRDKEFFVEFYNSTRQKSGFLAAVLRNVDVMDESVHRYFLKMAGYSF